jgi:hypothetical protein
MCYTVQIARKALELEEAKSVELSSELLTLANQKAALDTTASTMEKQVLHHDIHQNRAYYNLWQVHHAIITTLARH